MVIYFIYLGALYAVGHTDETAALAALALMEFSYIIWYIPIELRRCNDLGISYWWPFGVHLWALLCPLPPETSSLYWPLYGFWNIPTYILALVLLFKAGSIHREILRDNEKRKSSSKVTFSE